MSSDVRAWIGTVFRVVLAVILFWSGFAKLLEGSDAMRRAIIAYRLGISEHTVKFHLASLFSKLNVGSRTEAVTAGIRQGLVLL